MAKTRHGPAPNARMYRFSAAGYRREWTFAPPLGTKDAAVCWYNMPEYKVEYRECPEGALLKSSFVTAPNAEEAETAVKREFTAVQANLGARQYQILDAADIVVATHAGAEEPQNPAGVYS